MDGSVKEEANTVVNHRLVDQLDGGYELDGVFVVRETVVSRFVAIFFSILIATPAVILLWHFAQMGIREAGDFVPLAMLVFFSTLPILGGAYTLWEILYSKYFYLAIDDTRVYRRRGPFRMYSVPLSEVAEFQVSATKKKLKIRLKGNDEVKTLCHAAHFRRKLDNLATEIETWRSSPEKQRNEFARNVEVQHLKESIKSANSRIMTGVLMLALYPTLIVVAANVKWLNIGKFRFAFWGFLSVIALGLVVNGICKRLWINYGH